VDYLDTANYEPRDTAKFEYRWQWDYHDRFRDRGIMALLGSGFDPGATNVFTAWLQKHEFDTIEMLDIIDCNAGEHGQPFATNFNPEINIREVTARGRYWEDGAWHTTDPLSVSKMFPFPEASFVAYTRIKAVDLSNRWLVAIAHRDKVAVQIVP
jgi:saccharopine dehydrogenase (NAD+, L-lysine-forming)